MMARRFFVGVGVVCTLVVWAWCRPGGEHAHAGPADPVSAAEAADEHGGNYDEAAARYRSGQARHWRHVMIGNR
jgi:hypothetical protein